MEGEFCSAPLMGRLSAGSLRLRLLHLLRMRLRLRLCLRPLKHPRGGRPRRCPGPSRGRRRSGSVASDSAGRSLSLLDGHLGPNGHRQGCCRLGPHDRPPTLDRRGRRRRHRRHASADGRSARRCWHSRRRCRGRGPTALLWRRLHWWRCWIWPPSIQWRGLRPGRRRIRPARAGGNDLCNANTRRIRSKSMRPGYTSRRLRGTEDDEEGIAAARNHREPVALPCQKGAQRETQTAEAA
mmetsp:Transcript_18286/g.64223  ORF Transcript_18286/g.64223 Transcript_18286/m.64223 type:complete len:239 (+) Transcript_18286:397-1113(+)